MIREAITHITAGATLSEDEAAAVMEEIMTGIATPAQMGAFLTALRLRPGGETVQEITGMARVMRDKAVQVHLEGDLAAQALDTCGTGGDGAGTFNVSTAAGILVAAAGASIAKHGNRSATSRCGSADVLEALGAKIDLGPEHVARCVQEVGFGFMFAPAYHPAMKHVGPTRREIGIRTVFNILGPLTNPAYNATMLRELLSDYTDTPATAMLCLNAGAALLANERVSSLTDGVQLARATLREGKARRKLADVVAATQSHATVR